MVIGIKVLPNILLGYVDIYELDKDVLTVLIFLRLLSHF